MTTEDTMTTLAQEHSHSACYFGDRPHWLIAYAKHRDSDTITRSNWDSFVQALGGESETVAIERSSHWAVGWVDYLIVDPEDAERVALAEELRSSLEDYPVLDDMALSNLEYDEYCENWQNFGASDFCDTLKREFGLSDAAADLLSEADQDTLREWFESLITSGEYYIAEDDSVYPNVSSAVFHCQRDDMASFLRKLRAS